MAETSLTLLFKPFLSSLPHVVLSTQLPLSTSYVMDRSCCYTSVILSVLMNKSNIGTEYVRVIKVRLPWWSSSKSDYFSADHQSLNLYSFFLFFFFYTIISGSSRISRGLDLHLKLQKVTQRNEACSIHSAFQLARGEIVTEGETIQSSGQNFKQPDKSTRDQM